MTVAPTPVLIDTDVLIDYLRARQEAVDYVDNLSGPLFLSVITVAELYAGVRNETERMTLDTLSRAGCIVATIEKVMGLDWRMRSLPRLRRFVPLPW